MVASYYLTHALPSSFLAFCLAPNLNRNAPFYEFLVFFNFNFFQVIVFRPKKIRSYANGDMLPVFGLEKTIEWINAI